MSIDLGGPAVNATISSTPDGCDFFSRMRTDSSIESSSKGFMECLTPAVSTAVCVLLTRGLTCKYTCLACYGDYTMDDVIASRWDCNLRHSQ